MRLFSRSTLRDFWQAGHSDAEQSLRAWVAEIESATWTGPQQVRARYATADFVGRDRIVFNIGGNKYRLIVMILYASSKMNPTRSGMVFVRFLGTHAEYDKIDAATV